MFVFGFERNRAANRFGRLADRAGRGRQRRGYARNKVTAKHKETNQLLNAVSDAGGRFRFAYMPVGNYEVSCEQTGFKSAVYRFTATIGQALDIVLKMNPGDVTAHIDISYDDLRVETGRTQVTETIVPRDIEVLPLNGRNYLDLALLIPGVSKTNQGSVQRFAETSAVPGTGISVAGQRNLNNSFIVDGASANDDAADLAGSFYSQEVIREFQVVTSGAVAEFGRATAGFINIVTQSGTNAYRGKVYGFFRNEKLDARNTLAATKDPLSQKQFGGSFGGRIKADKTFFFANFEQTRRSDTSIITILPANVTAINNRLNQVNFAGPRIETGLTSGGYDATNLFGRIDHKIGTNNNFYFTYNFYDISAVNARTVGGLNAISRGTSLKNRDNTFNGGLISTVGSRSLNEFRMQYRKSTLDAPANDLRGPAVNITGVASFGIATFSPVGRDIDLFQVSDGFSIAKGNHSLKFGGEFLYNGLDIFFPGAIEGVYNFTSLNNFLSGAYSQFQQAFGATSQAQKNPNVGLFIQDEWKPRNDLTLNMGLRYDAQFLPDPIRTDTNNFAPRFGIAFAPADRKTVFRISAGLYFERIPLRATSNALQRDGSKYFTAIFTPANPGAPVFPNILSAAPSNLVTKPNVTRIDPKIGNAHSQQMNLQIERELPFNASFSIGYLHLRGLNLIISRNANVPTCTAAVNTNLCRPDPSLGNISRYESSGDSYYNGLVSSFNKRAGRFGSIRLSYTFSKTIDNAGNAFFSSPQNNFNLRDDRGLSDNDARHRLSLSGSIDAPRFNNVTMRRIFTGFQLSYILSSSTALPFNILTGNDRNGDTNFNDRPIGVARNTGKGFDFRSLDLRLSRKFGFTEKMNLEVLAEGFNILNRSNYSVPNNVFGTGTTPLASFGRPTAAQDARQIQIGLRFVF